MGRAEPYSKVMTLIDNGGSLQLTVPKAVVGIFSLCKGDRLRVRSDPVAFTERGLVLEAYLEGGPPVVGTTSPPNRHPGPGEGGHGGDQQNDTLISTEGGEAPPA